MAYINEKYPVYFSYASNDGKHPHVADVTEQLCKRLEEEGLMYRISKEHVKCGSINDFEIEIGYARCIIIVYNNKYFRSEHCMNEYAKIVETTKDETTRKIVLINSDGISLNDETINKLINDWDEIETNQSQYHKPITQPTIDHQYYNKPETSFSVQNINNFFSKYSRKKTNEEHILGETVLNEVITDIKDFYNKIGSNSTAPHFTLSVPDGLMQREDEEGNLFNLISKNRIVNLVGVGGSGKSSLAYLCLNMHKDDFNEISFVVVNNNIKDDIVDQINKTLKLEFEEDAYTEIITFLQENYQSEKPNLLALDINETADKDKTAEYINEILKNTEYLAGWKILILSRESVDTRNRIKTYNLNDKEDFDFLKKLFLEKAGARYNDFGDFEGLFKVIYYNPLLAEQLGLYLCNYPKTTTLDDIKLILGDTLREEEMQGMSAQMHDEKVISFLKKLIIYDKLEKNEQELLRHFVLWQSEYISYDVIADLLEDVFVSEDELIKTLTSLSKRSILATNNEETLSYKLHGLLKDSLREQIDIEKEDYDKYLWNIYRITVYGYYKFVPFVDCITNSLSEYDIAARNTCFLGYSLVNTVGRKLSNSWKRDHAIRLLSKNIRDIEEHIKKDKDNNSLYDQLILAHSLIPSAQSNVSKSNTEKAIEILEKMPKDIEKYQHRLAFTYGQYALQQSKFEDVFSIFDKIFEIRHNLPKTNEYQNELAYDYNALAVISEEKFYKHLFAKENFEKAIAIYEQLPKDIPLYQNNLAGSYINLADLQKDHLGDYDSAKSNFEKAIAIREQLPKNNPELRNDLARAYNILANLQKNHFGDYDSAKANYEKAIAIGEQLPKDNPKYQNDLAWAYNHLANLQKDHLGEHDSAKANYEKTIAIGEQLPKDIPVSQYVLASSYYNLANLQRYYLGDYDSAKANYEKAIAIREQLPKDIPGYQNGLANAYNNLAYTYDKLGNYDKAIDSINTAIDIASKLKETDSKYLIDWLGYKHSLSEIKYNNGKDLDEVKNTLLEIKPLAQQCLNDNPDDEWTKTVNDGITDLISKIE